MHMEIAPCLCFVTVYAMHVVDDDDDDDDDYDDGGGGADNT
jgi:hypothetical protein